MTSQAHALAMPAAKPILLSPPHLGQREQRLVCQALRSGWAAPVGPDLDAFEAEIAAYVGSPRALGTASGTAALHLALMVLGVRAHDEVLVPTFTFAASANPVRYCGAEPVFIDCTPDAWTMCPDLVEAELEAGRRRGKLPRAVVCADIYGECADYTRLNAVCAAYGVPIVQDAAEALGASHGGVMAGAHTRVGVLSFNGNKIITTSGGGMLLSHDAALIEHARHLATQARDPAPHYEHSHVGYNYRLSNLLAAVGRAQLSRLDTFVHKRRRTRAAYAHALRHTPGIDFMPYAAPDTGNAWLTACLVEPQRFGHDRVALQGAFTAAGIEVRPVWKPLHCQPVFAHCRRRGGRVAEGLFARGLCLPSGSALSRHDRQRVIEVFRHARTPRARSTPW